MLDGKIAAGKDTGFDTDQYLAWQGHFTRKLVKPGIQPAEAQESSLADILSPAGIHQCSLHTIAADNLFRPGLDLARANRISGNEFLCQVEVIGRPGPHRWRE